jgi:predicted DNA binding protein
MVAQGQPNEIRVSDESFSARLTIKNFRTVQQANERGYFDFPEKSGERDLIEVDITASTLDGLKNKIVGVMATVDGE